MGWAGHEDGVGIKSLKSELGVEEVREVGDGIGHGNEVDCLLSLSLVRSLSQRDRAGQGRGWRGRVGEGKGRSWRGGDGREVELERVERRPFTISLLFGMEGGAGWAGAVR